MRARSKEREREIKWARDVCVRGRERDGMVDSFRTSSWEKISARRPQKNKKESRFYRGRTMRFFTIPLLDNPPKKRKKKPHTAFIRFRICCDLWRNCAKKCVKKKERNMNKRSSLLSWVSLRKGGGNRGGQSKWGKGIAVIDFALLFLTRSLIVYIYL